ncbi:MAG: M15 family metallopeptidase [Cyanophyceae cyanobacterium]
MKLYQQIPIQECGEPLLPIPLEQFAIVTPHPYQQAGADYGGRSPYYLRQGVLAALVNAQLHLQQHYPGWQIQIFDAYRPVEVQQYMVNYTFAAVVAAQGLTQEQLSTKQQQQIWQQVYQIWAVPSFDPATPPPHSTGGAVDVTLVDEHGQTVDMGSEIDELSARSHPDYYAIAPQPAAQQYQARRQLLDDVMSSGGFCRHPGEWWHFSMGDQMWAWQQNQRTPAKLVTARYGIMTPEKC